ncbi:unnamed protein product [Cuscuta europaea]|uniref:Transmembrane protein n=1 Tax=Cuscuta europaea TaxID=41803 RepID=A0A9P1DXN1_CUSEU|nr:unnamed protein product [Cuscuta europaea]
MNQTAYCGRSLDPSLSHLYLMTRTTDHDELPTSRDRPRPSPQQTGTVAAPSLGRRVRTFCFILGASGVLFFPSLGFFPTGFFLMRFLTRHLPIVDQKVSTLGPLLKTSSDTHYSTPLHVITLASRSGGLEERGT